MARKKEKNTRVYRHTNLTAKLNVQTEEHLFAKLADVKKPLILILDGIQDPHNLGACLRSADAAGVTAVIAPKDRAASITETVRKVACGAAETVMFIRVTNLSIFMDKLKEHKIWIVGTTDQAKQSLYDIDLKGGIAIVTGAEGKGMRRLTTEKCDFLGYIPMQGTVPCLNASVATGIALFEAVRQRQ